MLLRWLRDRRRRRLLLKPFPPAWEDRLAEQFAYWRRLPEDDRSRLRDLLRIFINERHWEACGGITLTDEMKILIAAQACLLILNLDAESYRHVRTILVYPTGYIAPTERRSGSLISESEQAVLGQAQYRGPVILSWQHVLEGSINGQDGHNLVYHEFAHKLDMADGLVDGTPILHDRALFDDWVRVMAREYESLVGQVEGRHPMMQPSLLRPYGALNPAEFFAVATEVFFEQPRRLRDAHSELYDVLRRYFKQDPAALFERDQRTSAV